LGSGKPLVLSDPVVEEIMGYALDGRIGADAGWCLGFLDRLGRFVEEHGCFAPATRDERFGDLLAVLDEARSFYHKVAETADR
jgi:hypothetical protein